MDVISLHVFVHLQFLLQESSVKNLGQIISPRISKTFMYVVSNIPEMLDFCEVNPLKWSPYSMFTIIYSLSPVNIF